MIVDGVDPRDTEWDVDDPVYRVYFWSRPPAPAGVPPEHVMYTSDEYRLTEARDVAEVLEWAHQKALSGQTFTLYVEHNDGGRLGLIQLMGTDPALSSDHSVLTIGSDPAPPEQ